VSKVTATTRRVIGLGLAGVLLLAGCGKAEPQAGPYPTILGDTPAGAPLPPPRADLGILADQTTYQPASYAGGTGGRGRGSGTAATADAATAGKQFVAALLKQYEAGKLDEVIDLFTFEEIEPLASDYDFLVLTWERLDTLLGLLTSAYGTSSAQQLKSDLGKLATDGQRIEAQAEQVRITPNPLLVILGPQHTPPELVLVRRGEQWKIHLPQPLTAEALAEVLAYHEQVQRALDQLIEALDNKTIAGREAVYAALLKVGQGQPLEAEPGAAATQPGTATQPDVGADRPEEPPPEPAPEPEPEPEP
jgi:hypothetical protein